MIRTVAVLLLFAHLGAGFKIVLDLNTYNSSELAYLSNPEFSQWPGKPDGAWTILDNSRGNTTLSDWISALGAIGGQMFSEDNPGSDGDCKKRGASPNSNPNPKVTAKGFARLQMEL